MVSVILTLYLKINSVIHFNNNSAYARGAISSMGNCAFTADEYTVISFKYSSVITNGGALFVMAYSTVVLKGNAFVAFASNIARKTGGVVAVFLLIN